MWIFCPYLGDKLCSAHTSEEYEALDVGIMFPEEVSVTELWDLSFFLYSNLHLDVQYFSLLYQNLNRNIYFLNLWFITLGLLHQIVLYVTF